jgi:hypothetical protein
MGVRLVLWWARATSMPVSTTGWMLYAPGESWINDLLDGPWELEALTEPAGAGRVGSLSTARSSRGRWNAGCAPSVARRVQKPGRVR